MLDLRNLHAEEWAIRSQHFAELFHGSLALRPLLFENGNLLFLAGHFVLGLGDAVLAGTARGGRATLLVWVGRSVYPPVATGHVVLAVVRAAEALA